MTSPEYMASFARKFVKAGATFVGGCCGTTPNHMRSMRSALRAMDAMEIGAKAIGQAGATGTPAAIEGKTEPPPLAERSKIGSMIAAGEFVHDGGDCVAAGDRLLEGDCWREISA